MADKDRKLLEYFQAGYHLTAVDGVRYGFGTDLRKRVSNLRKCGYQIRFVWEKRGESRFKRYFMDRRSA